MLMALAGYSWRSAYKGRDALKVRSRQSFNPTVSAELMVARRVRTQSNPKSSFHASDSKYSPADGIKNAELKEARL